MRLVGPIGLEKFLTFSYLFRQIIYFFFGGRVLYKIKFIGTPSIQGSPPSDCSGCSQGHKALAIIPLLLTTGSPSTSGVWSSHLHHTVCGFPHSCPYSPREMARSAGELTSCGSDFNQGEKRYRKEELASKCFSSLSVAFIGDPGNNCAFLRSGQLGNVPPCLCFPFFYLISLFTTLLLPWDNIPNKILAYNKLYF